MSTIIALAPFVVAMRWPMLVAETWNHAAAKPETRRAVDEKIAALAEAGVAMQSALFAAGVRTWWQVATGRYDHRGAHRAPAAVVAAALTPGARRVSANYRRLGG
jgi:hypothetical protein